MRIVNQKPGARLLVVATALVVANGGVGRAQDGIAPFRTSFDGRRVLTIEQESPSASRSVWEAAVDGAWREQRIGNVGDCLAAFYLPKIYTLDAGGPFDQIGFLAIPPGDSVASLFTAHADGTRVRRITFAPSGVVDPAVLPDGRLLFRMKSGNGGDSAWRWFTLHTDGTELAAAREREIPDSTASLAPSAVPKEPPGESSVVRDEQSTGQLYGLDSRISRESTGAPIRRLRVLVPASVRGSNDANEGGSVVLGEAAVEGDGSFFLELPASTAFRLASLDERGAELQTMKTWMWLMPGERRGCIGCHEDRDRTPPNRHVLALRKPPQRIGLDESSPRSPIPTGGPSR